MNLALYTNMMKADTERADALFVNNCKSQKKNSNSLDEEEVALNWAYETIKNEYLRRMQIRSQIEKVKKTNVSKRKSRWTSKKLEAEKMKRKIDSGKYSMKTKLPEKQEEKKSSVNEIICESKEVKAKRSLEKLLAKEENQSTKAESEENNEEKHHVEIVRIQDTLKDKLKHKASTVIYTTNFLKTDQERVAAAQKLLSHLQEQKREREVDKLEKDVTGTNQNYEAFQNDVEGQKLVSDKSEKKNNIIPEIKPHGK